MPDRYPCHPWPAPLAFLNDRLRVSKHLALDDSLIGAPFLNPCA